MINKRFFLITVFLLSLTNFSFAQEDDFSLDKKFEELDNEEFNVTSEPSSSSNVSNDSKENLDQHIDLPKNKNSNDISHLEESLRIMNGKIEELTHKLEILSKNNEELKTKLEAGSNKQVLHEENTHSEKESSLGKVNNQPAEDSLVKKEPKVTANKKANQKQMRSDYDKAFAYLQKGDHENSQKAFEEFIANYPEEKLCGLAYFWLGETFYAKKDFENASLNYLYTVKKFPHSSKAGLATYKLGVSLAAMGKKSDACKVIGTFLDEYKDFQANVRSSATSKFNELGCKK